jgi:hypothetical protein
MAVESSSALNRDVYIILSFLILVTVYASESAMHRRRQRTRNGTTAEAGKNKRGLLGVDNILSDAPLDAKDRARLEQ